MTRGPIRMTARTLAAGGVGVLLMLGAAPVAAQDGGSRRLAAIMA